MGEKILHTKQMYQSRNELDPLVAAALETIVQSGLAGCTSREIAALAGQGAAAINRRFGSQSGLLSIALEQGVDAEIHRLQTIISEISDIDVTIENATQYLFATFSRVSLLDPPASILRWNVFAHGIGDDVSASQRGRLDDALLAVWKTAAHGLGLGEIEAMLFRFVFERLGRGILISNSPTLYLGWVQDLACRVVERLMGRLPTTEGDSEWRAAIALRLVDIPEAMESGHPTKSAIISATAQLLTHMGPFAISHRTIAEKAGASLSSVTHHFRSLDAILYAACLELIADATSQPESSGAIRPRTISELSQLHGTELNGKGLDIIRSLNQLELAAHYKPGFRRLGDRLLLRNGSSSMELLTGLTDLNCRIDMQDAVIWHHAIMGLTESALSKPKTTRRQLLTKQTAQLARSLFQS